MSEDKLTKGEGAADVVTPSGLKIHFESKPKRIYTIQQGMLGMTSEDPPQPQWQQLPMGGDPVEAVSVTTALAVLYKGGLEWWGMRVGIDAVCELVERGEFRLTPHPDIEGTFKAAVLVDGVWEYVQRPSITGDEVENLELVLKDYGLRVDKVKDSAASRGNNVHDALEQWALTGDLPDPSGFKNEQRGYVTALVAFLADSKITPVRSEILVGSYEHGFAGRFDLECHSPYDTKVVTKVFPKAGPKHVQLPIGLGMIDLKTSKDIYYNNLLQNAGYEGARIECGYEPTDWQGILNVNKDGRYQLRLNPSDHRRITLEDYVKIVQTYHVAKRAEEALKV